MTNILNPKSRPCLNCGKLLDKNVPFSHGHTRGLMSAPHGCPPEYDHSISMTLDKEEQQMLKDFVSQVGREK